MNRFYQFPNGLVLDLETVVAVSPSLQRDTFHVVTNSNYITVSVNPAELDAERAAFVTAWQEWKGQ